ncbi:MAG: Hpt domain-containing protein, partial [Deltaproteobacteria bacterium]|nr:Hpt domain-containing protein [Deltaproteobacteria bacterium]
MSDDTNNLDLKELYGEFVDESQDLLEDIARELVELEKIPSDVELIDKIFRALHTLKGNSGFIGLHDLSDIAHHMENVLGKLRDKEFSFFPAINTVLFKGLDISKTILIDFIENREADNDYSALSAELVALLEGPSEADPSTDLAEAEEHRSGSERRQAEERRASVEKTESAFMRVATNRLDKLVNLAGELAAGRSRLLQLKGELNSKAFDDVASFIASISAQLQSEVLSIRMVPIKQLFNKFF